MYIVYMLIIMDLCTIINKQNKYFYYIVNISNITVKLFAQ